MRVIRRESGARIDWLELEYLGVDPSGDADGDGVANDVDGFPNDSSQSGGGGTTDGGTTAGGTTDGGTTDGGTTDGGLRVEAESGLLVGAMTRSNDAAASNGAYVSVPGTGASGALNDYVELTFTVPQTGTYEVLGTVLGASSTSNSFFVEAGMSDTWLWHTARTGSSYQEDYVDSGGARVRVYFTAGTHKVRVYRRENGTRLDALELQFIGTDASGDVDGDGVANSVDEFPNGN